MVMSCLDASLRSQLIVVMSCLDAVVASINALCSMVNQCYQEFIIKEGRESIQLQ